MVTSRPSWSRMSTSSAVEEIWVTLFHLILPIPGSPDVPDADLNLNTLTDAPGMP